MPARVDRGVRQQPRNRLGGEQVGAKSTGQVARGQRNAQARTNDSLAVPHKKQDSWVIPGFMTVDSRDDKQKTKGNERNENMFCHLVKCTID